MTERVEFTERGVDKMKKMITLFWILLLASVAFAASPPFPSPVEFAFFYEGEPVENFQIELSLEGEKITKVTNELGKLSVDVGSGSPDFKTAKELDLRFAKLTITCGLDVCNKQYDLYELDTPYRESFILLEEPETLPVPDEPKEIPDKVECEECQVCIPPPDQTVGGWIIALIGALAIGGVGGFYFTKNKALSTNGGLKIYEGRDGTTKTLHKHPGIRGYHDPSTTHRDKVERHPKGQLFPQYEKNSDGVWEYTG